jgi:hypothetical protein
VHRHRIERQWIKQATFAGLAFDAKKKTTKRDKLLAEMDNVTPWSRLQALIEPCYLKVVMAARHCHCR